jgi:hypothetical protein
MVRRLEDETACIPAHAPISDGVVAAAVATAAAVAAMQLPD